jgi:hypothetical protein
MGGDPQRLRSKHVTLPPNVTYPAGQTLGPVTATPGQWKAPGTGVGPRRLILPYPVATDANGMITLGTAARADDAKFESIACYMEGEFFISDLTGIASDADAREMGDLIGGAWNEAGAIVKLR